MRAWLPQTQKWLATQLAHLPPGLRPVVACDRIENRAAFPMADLECRAEAPRGAMDRAFPGGARRRFIAGALRRHNGKLLHAHFGHMAWTDSQAAARMGTPIVASFYGFDATLLPRREPEWVGRYGELFDRADLVLAEAPVMADTLRRLGCPEGKLRVHHLGVDLTQLPFRPRTRAPRAPLRVLMAGRYVEKKGMPDGIRALAQARRAGLDAELTIVGGRSDDDPREAAEGAAIEAAIAETGLAAQVHLVGMRPFSDLVDLALDHHVLLCPSKTSSDGDTEGGLPVTLIELAATGMPVVATRHADIPEFVEDGRNGRLAQPGDVAAIARALLDVAQAPGDWPAMGQDSHQRAAAGFDAARQGELLGGLYRSLW
jgi:colanic acid/amylovoran biosynthesis glycosyltransferase